MVGEGVAAVLVISSLFEHRSFWWPYPVLASEGRIRVGALTDWEGPPVVARWSGSLYAPRCGVLMILLVVGSVRGVSSGPDWCLWWWRSSCLCQ